MTGSDNECNVNQTKDLAPFQDTINYPPSATKSCDLVGDESGFAQACVHLCATRDRRVRFTSPRQQFTYASLKAGATHAQQSESYAHVTGQADEFGGGVLAGHGSNSAAGRV